MESKILVPERKAQIYGWTLLLLITGVLGGLFFFGPEIHSNVEDAPTMLSRTKSTLIVFMFFGAIFLPVRGKGFLFRINHGIVILGTAFVGFIFLTNLGHFFGDFASATPNRWFGLLTLVTVLVVLVRKVVFIFKQFKEI
ncbi:hypothetical protein [Bdellovibrio bacteriovorus]|uniref:hypothetical protein n=1 Tax=Bdellovibrio bacteriovorus TaxID=959 RepID=UPI0035A87DE4